MTHRFAIAACPLALLAGTALGQTELYFTEYKFNDPRIKAIGLDGSNLRDLFTMPPSEWLPVGLTFDPTGGRLFWADSASPSNIFRSALDGTGRIAIANLGSSSARGPDLDGLGKVYFTAGNTVRRANIDGSAPQTIYTATQTFPLGAPCVDGTNGHVYVGADGEIKRFDLSGANVTTIVRGVSTPRDIVLDIANSHIYWVDANTNTDFLGRARLDDTEFTLFHDWSPSVVQSSGLITVVRDGVTGDFFLANTIGDDIIRRVSADGLSWSTLYASPPDFAPSGMALSTGYAVEAVADCNGNGVPDAADIASATSQDCNDNGMPDECEADACPTPTFLVDNGSNAASAQGRAIGVPSRWEQFQPFDVPAAGWTIGQVGLDGFTTNWADGSGMIVTVYPDNGANRPDETRELATTTINLRFNTDREVWVYAPLAVSLPEGRHWVRIEAADPFTYQATINHGTSGPVSLARGSSGNFTMASVSLAVRLIEGAAGCGSTDFDGDGDEATDADIEAFFSVIGGQGCPTGTCGSIDFDGDGDEGTDADIEAFFRVIGGGSCSL